MSNRSTGLSRFEALGLLNPRMRITELGYRHIERVLMGNNCRLQRNEEGFFYLANRGHLSILIPDQTKAAALWRYYEGD